jgi:transposase-like protein
LEEELETALGRGRYERGAGSNGRRHGHRPRQLVTTFGPLILDGTVVKVRLDRKATAISLLIALGVRRDGQKVVLAIKNMGGESEAA